MGFRPSKYFLDLLAKEREKYASQPGPCDVQGCPHPGEYRAPKGRDLKEYYHFCLDHVTNYNKNWDFFEGMSRAEIERQMYNTYLWDRPTWDMAPHPVDFERLQRRIYEDMNFFGERIDYREKQRSYQEAENLLTPESEAMAVLGLSPPLTWPEIQSEYKRLVKKYHPDLRGGSDPEAEEIMKKINMAYSVLKIAHQKYQELERKEG